jgi:hypothetical protein
MDGPDLAEQPGVPASVLGGITLLRQPVVKGRDWDVEDPEDGLDPEAVTMP